MSFEARHDVINERKQMTFYDPLNKFIQSTYSSENNQTAYFNNEAEFRSSNLGLFNKSKDEENKNNGLMRNQHPSKANLENIGKIFNLKIS